MDARTKKLQKLVITITVILVLGIGGTAVYIGFDLGDKISSETAAEENSIISTVVVQIGDIEKSISGTGNVSANQTQGVIMPVDGRVKDVLVKYGEQVGAGDALVKLDTDVLQDSLEALEMDIAEVTAQMSGMGVGTQRINIRAPISGTISNEHVSWNADVDEVITEYGALLTIENETQTVEIGVNVPSGTIKSTYADNGDEFDAGDILFKVDIETTAFAELTDDMSELRNDIVLIQKLLDDPYIKAPTSGIVTGDLYIEGTDITQDSVLFELLLPQNYTVTVMVNEIDVLESVYLGQNALITFENEMEFTGIVTFINSIAANDSGDYEVEVTIDSGQELAGNILIGQTADAAILVENVQDVLKVPIEAVFEDSKGQYVMVYIGQGDIAQYADMEVPTEKRYIEHGMVSELYVEVTSGLSEGETLIIAMSANEQIDTGKEGKGKSGVYGLMK